MRLPIRTRHKAFQPLPWFARALSLLLIAACLLMGVIGVLLPVIPGVLFFFLAVLLCTRVSSRAHRLAHENPWYRRQLDNWHRSQQLPLLPRVKLAVLVAIRSLVDLLIAGGKILVGRRRMP